MWVVYIFIPYLVGGFVGISVSIAIRKHKEKQDYQKIADIAKRHNEPYYNLQYTKYNAVKGDETKCIYDAYIYGLGPAKGQNIDEIVEKFNQLEKDGKK